MNGSWVIPSECPIKRNLICSTIWSRRKEHGENDFVTTTKGLLMKRKQTKKMYNNLICYCDNFKSDNGWYCCCNSWNYQHNNCGLLTLC